MSLVLNIRNCNPSNKKSMFVRMPLPFPAFITGQRYLLTNNSIRKNTVRKSIELFSFFLIFLIFSFHFFSNKCDSDKDFPLPIIVFPLPQYLFVLCLWGYNCKVRLYKTTKRLRSIVPPYASLGFEMILSHLCTFYLLSFFIWDNFLYYFCINCVFPFIWICEYVIMNIY